MKSVYPKLCLTFIVLITVGRATASAAAVVHVAPSGSDDPACGDADRSCRTISQAIANASAGDEIRVAAGTYGDSNGDGDFDDPGDEPAEIGFGCGCVVLIDKPLRVVSEEGAERTRIDGGPADGGVARENAVTLVSIAANDVVFGEKDHGFTLEDADSAITVGREVADPAEPHGVMVAGNIARRHVSHGFFVAGVRHRVLDNEAGQIGESDSFSPGFPVIGREHRVERNRTSGGGGFEVGGDSNLLAGNESVGARCGFLFGTNFEAGGAVLRNTARDCVVGFDIRGDAVTVQGNFAESNDRGFDVSGGAHVVTDNLSVANLEDGYFVQGHGHVFDGNVAFRNSGEGFDVRFGRHLLRRNLIQQNGIGISSYPRRTEIRGNRIIENEHQGIILRGRHADQLVVGNHISRNLEAGVDIHAPGAVIRRNNIFDNGSGPLKPRNCGLLNTSGGQVHARHNYWGANTGPGREPADRICGPSGGEVVFEPFASEPIETRAPKAE